MKQTKDLSFLARAARTLTGATTMARAAVMLLAVMIMTALGVQTARADLVCRWTPSDGGTVTASGSQVTVTPAEGYYVNNVTWYSADPNGGGTITSVELDNSLGYYAAPKSDGFIVVTFKPYTNNVLVKFNMKGHGGAIEDRNQTLGETVTRPSPDPTAASFVFHGWYTNSGCTTRYDFDTELDNTLRYDTNIDCYTLTLYAGWGSQNVRVSFDMMGHGTAPADRDQMLGETVTQPDDPTADGYVFFGWFTDNDCTMPYDFTTVLDNSLTYDASNERFTLTLHAMWLAEADLTLSGSCGKVDAKARPPLDGSEVTWAVTKSAGSSYYDVLTISGSGAMTDYSNENNRPWKDLCAVIKTIVIGEGVTTISKVAFKDFVNVTSDITIPVSVTSIGESAFARVSKNTAAGIHISASEGSALASIGNYAFNAANVGIDLSRCNSLTVSNTNTYIFRAVTKDVILPSSMTSICQWAFSRYSNGAFLGDHAYVVVPEGKALSVTITLKEGTESRVLAPTDGKADILGCLYANPLKRSASRALTLAMVDMLGDNNCTMTGWGGTTRDVALCRTLPAGKKQTVCLPFAPEALLSLGTVWEFTGIEGGKAVMTQRTSWLTANTPYIFEANASNPDVTGILFPSVNISISSDPKTTKSTDVYTFTFQGTYERKHWEASEALAEGIYGFLSMDSDEGEVGQFVKCDRNTNIKPFRAYLKYAGELTGTQGASARRTSAEELPEVIDIVWKSASGEATGITTTNLTNFTNAADAWYSLDGRRLSGEPTKKGMYLNNGKKIIIK
jgi:uncharacterized repeat protein (TIGR02543 family)